MGTCIDLGRGRLGHHRSTHGSYLYLGDLSTAEPIELPDVAVRGHRLLARITGGPRIGSGHTLGTIRALSVPTYWIGEPWTRPHNVVAIYLDNPNWSTINNLGSQTVVKLQAVT